MTRPTHPMPGRRPTRRRARSAVLAPLLVLLALAGGACAGASEATDHAAQAPAPAPAAAPAPTPEPTVPPDATAASAADLVARPAAVVRPVDRPGGEAVVAELAPTTELGSARALLVVGEQVLDGGDRWLEVLLPVRPNGTTGWLPAAGIELRSVDLAVEVDLTARTLTLTDGGEVVLTTAVAVGAADTPTPTGTFSLTDTLATPEPGSPYGPFALGLSGHSDVLTEFAGGDGQIGIHGTDDPGSIGQAVSHGCVRVPNDVIATLSGLLPLGTPVTVR